TINQGVSGDYPGSYGWRHLKPEYLQLVFGLAGDRAAADIALKSDTIAYRCRDQLRELYGLPAGTGSGSDYNNPCVVDDIRRLDGLKSINALSENPKIARKQ